MWLPGAEHLTDKYHFKRRLRTMKIERTYPESMTNEDKFDMLTMPGAKKLNENYGARIVPAAIIVYITDSETRCMTIKDVSGEMYRTSGNAAIQSVCNGLDILGDDIKKRYIVPVKRTSKNGREYCSAELEKA